MADPTVRVIFAGDADALSRAATKAQESLGKLGKWTGGKFGSLMKGGMLAAGAAAAGALIVGFQGAMQNEDALAKLKAQAGDAKWSANAGKIAGNLYKNAYGDSIAETADAVKTVFQSGLIDTSAPQAEVEALTGKAISLGQAFDQEVGPLAAAAGQMIKTGLAKDSTEAFDIITKGFQGGIDKSGDYLDTLNEYGTQFRKLGLSGAQATGLMAQGLQAGARDADTVADAIKEFAIRAIDGSKGTAAGFAAIGLDAEKMAKTIGKGGDFANEGLDVVLDKLRAIKDPVERSAAAVQLFGTKAEDLGDSLYALDPSEAAKGLGDVAGAAGKVDAILGGTTSATLTSVTRKFKSLMSDAIAKALPVMIRKFGEIKTKVMPILQRFGAWFTVNALPVIKQFAGWVTTSLLPAVKRFATQLWASLQPALKQLGASLRNDILPAIKGMIDRFRQVWPTVQKVLVVVGKLAAFILKYVVPILIQLYAKQLRMLIAVLGKAIGIVVGVIGKLIAFGTTCVNVGKKVWAFATAVGDAFRDAYNRVKKWIGTIVDFVAGLPGKISRATSGMFDGIKDAFRSAINFVIRAWNGLQFSLPKIDLPFGKSFGGGTIGVPDIPELARGGDVRRAGLALVGENGPELLGLPQGASVSPLHRSNGGGGGGVQRVELVIDLRGGDDEFMRWLRKRIRVTGGLQASLGTG